MFPLGPIGTCNDGRLFENCFQVAEANILILILNHAWISSDGSAHGTSNEGAHLLVGFKKRSIFF